MRSLLNSFSLAYFEPSQFKKKNMGSFCKFLFRTTQLLMVFAFVINCINNKLNEILATGSEFEDSTITTHLCHEFPSIYNRGTFEANTISTFLERVPRPLADDLIDLINYHAPVEDLHNYSRQHIYYSLTDFSSASPTLFSFYGSLFVKRRESVWTCHGTSCPNRFYDFYFLYCTSRNVPLVVFCKIQDVCFEEKFFVS